MATRETADTHASGRSSRLWLAVALTTLLVGLGLSAFTALGWSARQRRDGRQGFDSTAQSVSGTVGTLVRADVTFVASLRTVLTMQPHLSPTAFDDWYERLEVTQRQVGGIGSGVVDSVPAGQLTRFQIPRDSDRAFQRLVGGRIEVVTPDGRRRQCLLAAARIAVPIAGPFAQLAQSDLCSPHSLAGSYEAPLLSELTDSGRFVVAPVVAAWLRTTLFEMAFYRRGVPLRTVAQRRSAVAGWLVSSFDLPTLITQAIGGNHGLQVELMFTEPDGRATLLATGGDAGARGRLSQTTTVAVDGDWTVVVRGAPVVGGLSAQSGGILVFLSGAAITVLLSLLLLTLSRSRERALAMVAEKTAQLRHQALHDALTGLPNRVLVLDRAEQMLARALRSRTPIALLYIDVDGFKHINDTFGHAIGDRFLQLVAARLLSVVRESDTAARLGGDEFIVLLEGASIETGPEAVAERVLDVLREPYDLTRELGRQLTVSASIGVAFGQPETAEALLADGDVALYAAKEGGKNRFVGIRARDADPCPRPDQAGAGPGRGDRPRPAVPRLSADVRPELGTRDRRRGAPALAAPRARGDRARRVDPDRRGGRSDRRDRTMGAGTGLRAGRRLARRGPHGVGLGQRLRPPAGPRPAHRRRSRGPAANRARTVVADA